MPQKTDLSWNIGDVTVTRIVENEYTEFLEHVISDGTPENLLQIPWLKPNFITDDGRMKWSLHALAIRTPSKRIIVDTCVGNDKVQEAVPFWNKMHGPFLERLAKAGFARETVDVVLCTHLHADHIGWNTMMVDGKWVPTFPNARYLLSKKEVDFWKEEEARTKSRGERDPRWGFQEHALSDSILPVFAAGLVDLVATNHTICDEVRLIETSGHTPGHVSVEIRSKGQTALITGDFVHHPCQLAHPEWATTVDYDTQASTATRRRMFLELAGTPALVIGTHWAPPTAGRMVRDGDAFRLDC